MCVRGHRVGRRGGQPFFSDPISPPSLPRALLARCLLVLGPSASPPPPPSLHLRYYGSPLLRLLLAPVVVGFCRMRQCIAHPFLSEEDTNELAANFKAARKSLFEREIFKQSARSFEQLRTLAIDFPEAIELDIEVLEPILQEYSNRTEFDCFLQLSKPTVHRYS